MNAAALTVVIVGAFEMRRVDELAIALRRRGFAVLALESISLVAPLMATQRVSSVVVFEIASSTQRWTRYQRSHFVHW